jgi:hypothetical protein
MEIATSGPAPRVIRFHHRCLWATVFKWHGFRRALEADHGEWLATLPPGYRRRVARSAVRVTTFIYMFSLSLRCPFDLRNALISGILAAVFDDLFDLGFETSDGVAQLLEDPDMSPCRGKRSCDFLTMCRLLRSRMPAWQREQLARLLGALADHETRLLEGRVSPAHWKERGTTATEIFLTILGIPESRWDKHVMGCFGQYFQMLDDLEDYASDPPEVNYFRAHPEMDLDAYFGEALAPALPRLFSAAGGDEPGYDPVLLTDFLETNHVFMLEFFADQYPSVRRSAEYVYPWIPPRGPLERRGWLSTLWWYVFVFGTTALHRFLPTRAWRPLSRMALGLFGWS